MAALSAGAESIAEILASTLPEPPPTSAWLTSSGQGLTKEGEKICLENAWEVYGAALPFAGSRNSHCRYPLHNHKSQILSLCDPSRRPPSVTGDGGVCDSVLTLLAGRLRARELNMLASETLALYHGLEEDGFGLGRS